jgi:DNA polymerase III epsilon subunit-like protein
MGNKKQQGPRVLLLDIETAPVLGYVWSLWDQNVGLNQVKSDWYILAWAAKWLGDPPSKIMYRDQRKAKNVEDDSAILKDIWKLMDEADIIITQNGKAFDAKKLNARFVIHGMQPPSSYKHIDTKQIAKSKFGFTSNKLEYLTDKLCKKYKKQKHAKFSGFDLWKECLAGNPEAWAEMEKYNKYDVLSLEELYTKLQPWDNTVNFSVYYDEEAKVCACGSRNFRKAGHTYSSVGKYQRYRCSECGAESRNASNEFSKLKRQSLTRKVS